jgi:uncharacterized protein YukE
MSASKFDDRITELNEQLNAKNLQIEQLRQVLQGTSRQEFNALVVKFSELDRERSQIINSIYLIRQQEREFQENERKKAGLAERRRKEKLVEATIKQGSTCPNCGSPGKVLEKPTQPTAYSTGFWEIPTKDWSIEFRCTNPNIMQCALRWRLYPDREKKPAKKRSAQQ